MRKTNNPGMAAVIGGKGDRVCPGSNACDASMFALVYDIHEYLHRISYVYPELASSVTLTKASGAWAAYPTPTEIIPANTITSSFNIHYAIVDTLSATGIYTIRLYQGAAGAETLIGVIAPSRSAAMSQEGGIPVMTPVLAANTRISAAMSSNNSAQNTVKIKLKYNLIA